MLKRSTFFFSLCYLLLWSSGQSCDSLEEGTIWNYICAVQNFSQTLTFELERNNIFEKVATCDKSFHCWNFNSGYSLTLSLGSPNPEHFQGYTGRLEMKPVKRQENHFRCLTDDHHIITDCHFQTYTKPKKPLCRTPVLEPSGKHVSVTCRTDRVYPMAACVFLSDALPANVSIPVTYRHLNVKPGGMSTYMSTQCEGRIPLENLPKGQYQFAVVMYADVSHGKEKSSVKSQLTPPLELYLPTVTLSKNCQNDLVKSNTTATCTCELTNKGSPPGHAQWYTSEGVSVGRRHVNGSATLSFIYDESNPNLSYKCVGESYLKGPKMSVSFHPSFVNDEGQGSTSNPLDLAYLLLMSVLLPSCVIVILIVAIICIIRHRTNRPTPGSAADPHYQKPTALHDNHEYAGFFQGNPSNGKLVRGLPDVPSSSDQDQGQGQAPSTGYITPIDSPTGAYITSIDSHTGAYITPIDTDYSEYIEITDVKETK